MKRWRGWAAVLILAASGCARERHAPSFVPPLDLAALPTSEVVVRFVTVTRTPTPAAPSQPAALPVEPAWGGAAECLAPAQAPVGSGRFIWPADHHFLSGYDFSAAHPGLDLAAEAGAAIYAADAGAVVYSGWNQQGYGSLVVLDHGNGWHSLYAHLSQVNVACGQAVQPGDVLGLAGSTGHSTGPHLHFELRGPAGRVNPWDYLP